jgi:hypothetical protein
MGYRAAFWCTVCVGILVVVWGSVYIWLLRQHVEHTRRHQHDLKGMWHDLAALHDRRVLTPPPDDEEAVHAVMVEPRAHVNLTRTVNNVLTVLPEVHMTVFTGQKGAELLSPLLEHFHGRLRLQRLERDNFSAYQYNWFLTRPAFYQSLPGRQLLVVQTDAVLLSNSTVKLTDYAHFDYVGAPWSTTNILGQQLKNVILGGSWHGPDRSGGNGGLSLRNRQTMIRLTQEQPFESFRYMAEDLYIAFALVADGRGTLPDRKEASRLFCEEIGPGYAEDVVPLGLHQQHPPDWVWQQMTDEEKLILVDCKPLRP